MILAMRKTGIASGILVCATSVMMTSLANADVVMNEVVQATDAATGNTVQVSINEVQIPVTAGLGALAGFTTYDFVISSDQDLRGISLWITPRDNTTLEVYNDAVGDDTPPNPAFFSGFPTLEYDTYVDVPVGNINILGKARNDDSGQPTVAVLGPDTFSASWGTFDNSGPITDFVFARVTLRSTPVAAQQGVTVLPAPVFNVPFFFAGAFTVGNAGEGNEFIITNVPEPASLALISVGGLLLLRRRRVV